MITGEGDGAKLSAFIYELTREISSAVVACLLRVAVPASVCLHRNFRCVSNAKSGLGSIHVLVCGGVVLRTEVDMRARARAGAVGDRLKEAQSINYSLSALGDVINARANSQAHIPFRNSVLTQVLQDSLSANSKTLMIVQVSPAEYNSGESLCSLRCAASVVVHCVCSNP